MNPDYHLILDYLSSLEFNPVFREIRKCFTYPPYIELSYQFVYREPGDPEDPPFLTLQIPTKRIEGTVTPNGSRVKNGMVIYETRWRDHFTKPNYTNYVLKFCLTPDGWIFSCLWCKGDSVKAVREYAEVY